MSKYVFSKLAADVSITDPAVWTTLITNTIVVAGTGSKILAIFSASGTKDLADVTHKNTYLRILYDGAVVEPSGAGGATFTAPGRWPAGSSAFWEAAAGSHTVALQWRCDAGTANIQPISLPNEEHACLWTEEIPGGGDGVILAAQHSPVEADLAADKTANTDGTTFSNLITGNITTVEANSQILCTLIFSGQKKTANGAVYVRIKVDGSVKVGASCSSLTDFSLIIPIVVAQTVTAGAHTVDVEWVSANNGAQCNALGAPTFSAVHLVMQEKPL